MIISEFNAQEFIRDYWQKKPCVIKQFIPGFCDPIDEHDLAGLAQESEVDCRIVSKRASKRVSKEAPKPKSKQASQQGDHTWHVAQGPFDSFEEHCQGDWSLLVQGVDRYIPEIDELAKQVDFIPNWRFDDVMVSYSVPQAGVGAHTDEYDVFIIQGKGSRRWQVGLPSHEPSAILLPHPLLQQIEAFTPCIDEVLAPGDVVYIPPKHPHNGLALSECLNYSIGFRAPTNLETLNGLLDETDELSQVQQRYQDPNMHDLRGAQLPVAEVSQAELKLLKHNMLTLLESEQAEHALMQYLSRQALPDVYDSQHLSVDDVSQLMEEPTLISKMPGVRPIYSDKQEAVFSFYIDGNLFEAPSALRAVIIDLLNADPCDISGLYSMLNTHHQECLLLFTQVLNSGYWEILD